MPSKEPRTLEEVRQEREGESADAGERKKKKNACT
jgi:hypothetical protein